MRRSFCRKTSPLLYAALALGAVAGDRNLSGQTPALTASPFEAGAGLHETRAQWQNSLELPNASEGAAENEIVAPPPPTRSSFMATWPNVSGAKGYLLDVSTSSSFNTFVDGYHDFDVCGATGRVVTGLSRGTTYYYRVRAYGVTGPSGYSETMAITTEPTTGLIIHATFDSSITGNPNAAAIEAMINRAIAICESLFSDPMTVEIRFRYATTAPDGTPLPQGSVSRSDFVIYTISWSTFIDALRADARSSNDNVANASLPGTALATTIEPSSANGRAVGLDTAPAMFADGTVGPGGPYDGIVTLNSSVPLQFTRPTSAGSFDAQRATEHEMDELIGLGSKLGHTGIDFRPQDLFSWSSAGLRNTSSSGTRYFSINGGVTNIVNFNQDPQGDFGDWLSEDCPQSHPYVQNAFLCTGQSSDVTATSPEGINLDVIGYDLANTPIPTPTPTPIADPCYPNFATAEGCDALRFLTTGAGNTALGWRSLFSNNDGSFNTGVGGGALALNNGSSNTALGAAALVLNAIGVNNTAVGTDALVFNDSGSSNTATGYFALMNNTTGGSNTAIGGEVLTANIDGNNNTAIGNLALMNDESTSDHVCVGREAGSGITTANNNVIIGHHSGVHSVFGQESDRCIIDNIFGSPVSATAAMVMVDSDGRLGTVASDGPAPGGSSPNGIRPQAIPDAAKQAMLDLTVQKLEATISQQQQQIETLTAQLKEQAAQIQKVNARLELRKPGAKMIVNKPKAVLSERVHGQ
jgi:hypothetical protein